jgi:hypothetical protein
MQVLIHHSMKGQYKFGAIIKSLKKSETISYEVRLAITFLFFAKIIKPPSAAISASGSCCCLGFIAPISYVRKMQKKDVKKQKTVEEETGVPDP